MGSVSAIDLKNASDETNLDDDVPYSPDLEVYSDYILEISSFDDANDCSFNEYGELDGEDVLQDAVKQTFLFGNDTELYYRNGTVFKVVLSDDDGSLLANQNVTFTINNVNYTRITNGEGIASIAINLNTGTYTIYSFYAGNENCSSSYAQNTIKVLSTISGENLEKYFKGNGQYSASFVDGKGNLLNDVLVTFNINGRFYQRKTNENGVASLNINLPQGKYIVTATNSINGEMHSNNITVLTTMFASDIVKYYKNDTQYCVCALDGAGNLLVNQDVTFNINGIFYTRATNASGIAKLNINLPPGKYIVTAINSVNGEMHSNNIEVLPTISANDLNMAYRDGHNFTATVLDNVGNPLANSYVKFNVNGVFYTRITDNEGNAHLNINLPVGKYIITATNYNGLSVSKNIIIEKSNATIKANDAHIITGFDRDYTVILSSVNNQIISSNAIKFKFNGAEMVAVTNNNGEATIHISNPCEGEYTIEYEFEGNWNYHPYKSSSKIVVANSTTILTGKDLKMFYGDGSKFNVTLTDKDFIPMVNETVTFNVNGRSYNRTTDSNGVASLDINLIPGTYKISYSYSHEDAIDYNRGSNTILVSKLPAYLFTNDLIFDYGDNKAFAAVLTDANNNPLNGIGVTFTICGRSYTRTTNDSGVAKLNINLPVGYYEIVTSLDNVIYAASSKSNHVLVNGTILVGNDLILINGLTRDYSVTLMDAYRKPVPNAVIEFTYNGISARANTNNLGVATISVGGLSEGNYPIVYDYVGGNNTGQANIHVSNSVLNSKNTISNLSPYLSSSRNCPVSNAEIVALARQLTENFTKPLDKAMAIFEYVRDAIPYSYYYNTYYGALGTLHAQIGNCVDQAHLSVALYRAAGLPARYVHGTCVFGDGDVSGHVWAQVLVEGTWVVSDSINRRNTLGEVVNWNNYNYNLKGYYSSIYF